MPTQPDKRVSRESIVTVTQLQVSCEVNRETVILHFHSGEYFELNDVGTLVWTKMVGQPRSIRELRDAILSEYEIDAERCERELLDLLEELSERDLIEIRNLKAA